MLKRLFVKDFTVFAEADFEFGPGLNVVVGTNGTGKSHVLKLGYAVLNCLERRVQALNPKEAYEYGEITSNSPKPHPLDFAGLDEKLVKIFRPSPTLPVKLVRRDALKQEATIEYTLDDKAILSGSLTIKPNTSREKTIPLHPSIATKLNANFAAPIFIPAKEVLTLGWMLSASRQFKVPMDETYLDLLAQLSGLALQKPEPAAAAAIATLTEVLGGEVEEQNGSFFLVYPKEERMEMNLVAEGLRKFGTLQKLLANGSLTPKSTLFWDEPEANLNPVLLKKLAAVLAALARQGFQIILATHSLFLLKELHILSRQKDVLPLPVRYFGLNAGKDGATEVVTTDDFEGLPDIAALDEEIEQSGEFLDVLNQEQ